jgi:hypothetical protein
MSSSVVLKALGLNLSPNQLELPNGSLTVANNVIIKRSDVLEQRRGFKLYGNLFGASNNRTSQLFSYKARILRQYASTLQFDSDGSGTFSSFSGTYSQAEAGLRTKSIEANGNFYFTSSNGIKVLSAASNSEFTTNSGYIINAGVPKAIDFTAATIPPTNNSIGFLPADSAVAYRTTWAIKDANTNLKIGSPSQPVAVYSPLTSLLNQSSMNVLEALDSIAISPIVPFFSNYSNYVNSFKVGLSTDPVTLRTNLINLASQIDNDIRYANDTGAGGVPITIVSASHSGAVCTIITSGANPGIYFTNQNNKQIYLTGFTNTGGITINGGQTVTSTTPTSISFTPVVPSAGAITVTGATINSGYFRGASLTIPGVPSVPATNAQLAAIQLYLNQIILGLQSQSSLIISSLNQTNYASPLIISTSTNVRLRIQIPQDITLNNFLQIYRSTTVTAVLTDILDNLVPNSEETQLVYEAYPTQAELSAGVMIVDDITPDIFKGANLYTNQSTGEGILQANDVPPFALDVNRFKNVVFYANTKTRHRLIPFSMIGVANMVTDALNGIIPTITVANANGVSNTYTFVLGIQQITTITTTSPGAITTSTYFDINSANNTTMYRVWYDKTGVSSPPASGGRVLVKVDISSASITTATQVAQRTRDVLSSFLSDFSTISSTNIVTVLNTSPGFTASPSAGTSGFTVAVTSTGHGENIANKQILLSQNVSPAISVDETSRSMVRVLNANPNEQIYIFYTSTIGQVPGKMVLEDRTLADIPFYIIGNNANTGGSFFPNISPVTELNTSAGRISIGNPTIVISAGHRLINNDQIVITNSDSTPSINGIYNVLATGVNTFTIPVNVTVAGTKLSYSKTSVAKVSQNEVKPNRIYYSKLQQPESTPILNFLDIGAADKEILRIFPLRDSLFIFKEDGLFRISGEVAPFYVSLFDSSCICIAPDSVSVSNNLVHAYTRQGISTISEAGVQTISRQIDTEILKVSSDDYTNFKTSTWGIGYESDNSYTVYTVSSIVDNHATKGYRYSNLTNTWTTIGKDSICGIIHPLDDKMYLGAGDTNFIEQERKSFSRLDYADRELPAIISNNQYIGSQIHLSSIIGFSVGDVLEQTQLLTIYKYNALLEKLDIDPFVALVPISLILGSALVLTITANSHNLSINSSDFVTIANNTSIPSINGTFKATYIDANTFQINILTPLTTMVANGTARLNYSQSLLAKSGDNLRTKLVTLAAKLDTDPGINFTTYSTLIIDIPTANISLVATGNTPQITTTSAHGLVSGRYVIIGGSNAIANINGDHLVTVIDAFNFTIPQLVNIAGTNIGTVNTLVQTFEDIKGSFNAIINNLNADTGVAFSNYKLVSDITSLESVITDIDPNTKKITLRDSIEFVVGPTTIFKSIISTIVYAPNTMGDPLGLKHLREATIMFLNRAFTSAILSFSTDLLPKFIDVSFAVDGNGIFGMGKFGDGFFGGVSNSAPFRTYIPRDAQRCRYMVIKFVHNVAREEYSIYGITLTGEISLSTRAYR